SPVLIASMNAAASAVSVIDKLYLRGSAYLMVLVFSVSIARAQSGASIAPSNKDAIQVPSLGSSLTVTALADLPSSGGNLFTLLDTVIPELISDRVDSGGLNVGGTARLGAHGSSWTQTLFRLDGVDITDGDGSGAPLLLPGGVMLGRVVDATGPLPIG